MRKFDNLRLLPSSAVFEELGDTLFAHKQYQAAIEAYKKAPSNSASVLGSSD
jgi:predicted negative regulator of RcsB-dependent stress response